MEIKRIGKDTAEVTVCIDGVNLFFPTEKKAREHIAALETGEGKPAPESDAKPEAKPAPEAGSEAEEFNTEDAGKPETSASQQKKDALNKNKKAGKDDGK